MPGIDYDLLAQMAEESGIPEQEVRKQPLIRQQVRQVEQEKAAADPMRFFNEPVEPTSFDPFFVKMQKERFFGALVDHADEIRKMTSLSQYTQLMQTMTDVQGLVVNDVNKAYAQEQGVKYLPRRLKAEYTSNIAFQQKQQEQKQNLQLHIEGIKMLEAAGLDGDLDFRNGKFTRRKEEKPVDITDRAKRIKSFAQSFSLMGADQQRQVAREQAQLYRDSQGKQGLSPFDFQLLMREVTEAQRVRKKTPLR